MARDFNAEVISIILPDHGALGDIEEVLLPQLLAVGELYEVNVGGGVAVLRRPVGNDVFGGAELELVNALGGEGALVQELHGGRFEYGDEVLAHACQVLVVMGPVEGRGWNGLALLVGLVVGEEVLGEEREGAQQLAGAHREDLDGIGVRARVVGGEQVILLGTEQHKLHTGRGEAAQLLVVLAAPQNDSLGGHHGRQIRPSWRPLHVIITPRHTCLALATTVVIRCRLVLSVIPRHNRLLSKPCHELLPL
mmetsp:Transcript_16995/g.24670  ORF Transcript_16995/g.24670 Transcript_16995/m.24670 type:complete len:251 (-) Transcript_16995:581-1333(-)